MEERRWRHLRGRCIALIPQDPGNSLNPARSIGPALFVGGSAIAQLWLYIIAPIVGGYIAGLLFKSRTLEA